MQQVLGVQLARISGQDLIYFKVGLLQRTDKGIVGRIVRWNYFSRTPTSECGLEGHPLHIRRPFMSIDASLNPVSTSANIS